MGLRLSPKHTFKINADYHYGDWGKPRGFNGDSKYFTQIRNEEESAHANISYQYSPKGVIDLIKVSAYVDNGKRDYFKYKYSEISGKLSSLELVHYKDFLWRWSS